MLLCGPVARAHDDPATIDDRLLASAGPRVGFTVNGRQRTAIAISGLAHAALFAWVMGHARPTTDDANDRTHVSIERVVLDPPAAPPAPTPASIPDAREPGMAARPPESARRSPPPAPPKPRTRRPSPRPLTPPLTTTPESTAAVVVDPPPEPTPAPTEAAPPDPPVPRRDEGRARATTGRGDRTASAAGWGSGGGTLDHAGYGRALVQLFLDELDRSPVPGISKGHSITILLRVSPKGRLVWTGTGRFDFARVLTTTLGPLRTRRVLRRLERASWRFPPHPDGFERTYYELDFTVKFKGDRPQ